LIASVLAALVAYASLGPSALAVDLPSKHPRGPGPTTSSTVPVALQQAILRDYEAYWSVVFGASDPPRPDDPGLAQYGAGQALGDVRQVLVSDAAGGLVRRGSQVLDPTVLSVTGNTATVRDCYRDKWLPYALEGNTLGVPAGTLLEEPSVRLRLVTLQLDGTTWKTTSVTPPYEQQRSCGSLAAEQRVIDAYRRYELAMSTVFSHDNPNPNDARLKAVLTATGLGYVQQSIRDDAMKGMIRRRSSLQAIERATVEVLSYSSSSATVQSCLLDDGTLTDARSGVVLSAPNTTPATWTYELMVEHGTWKVVGGNEGGPCQPGT